MKLSSRTKLYTKTMISLIVLSLLASVSSASVMAFHSSSSPVLSVEPFLYRATHLGEVFNVTVGISDVDVGARLVGVEFKLQYNETMLETHESWFTEGSFFKSFGTTFSKAYIETDADGGEYLHAFVILLPSEAGNYSAFPHGYGTIASITFNATYRQATAVSCKLGLFDTILVDSDVNTIAHAAMDGFYQMARLPSPTLEVLPEKHVALRTGETFEVNVNMKGLDKDWHLIGLQFKLPYDTNLLTTKTEWVLEGSFLKAYGTTFFQVEVESDYGLIGILILPNENGSRTGDFPEGEGTLATLTFETIYQPMEQQGPSSCTLALDDVILLNDENEEMPYNTSDGEFEIMAASATVDQYRPIEVQVDVGAIHFNGEIANFYILLTDYGKLITPDNVRATLYLDGALYSNLTTRIEHVAEGLYRAAYTIPAHAQPGTYVLLVQAEYLQVSGSAIRSFVVSSTLSNMNAYITNIKDNVASVIIPSLGQIELDLASVNATLVSIGNDVATIHTSVGTLTTDMANLDAKVVSLDGDVATVQTSLGSLQGDVTTIKVKVTDLPAYVQTSTNLLYATTILSLIAAIAAVLAVLSARKK